MLYRADSLLNQNVDATDGVVGVVKDLYFDDVSWKLRYIVVDTGGWLTGRDVLLSPESLVRIDMKRSAIVTRLSQQQIENSPPSETNQPVSRLSEIQLSQYYGWSPYWSMPSGLFPAERASFPEAAGRIDPNLRSFRHLKNYGLQATDGNIGQVEDLLIDPESWDITHLVVDARLWWPGGLVVIDRSFIQEISWPAHRIAVAMTRDQVKDAPAFEKDVTVNDAYETRLSDYFGSLRSPDKSTNSDITTRSWIPEQPSL